MVILGNLGNDVYYIAGAQNFQREVKSSRNTSEMEKIFFYED